MPAPDVNARCFRRNERERDTDIAAPPKQVVRIVQAKREAEQRSDRTKRDIALFPSQPDAKNIRLALPCPAANDAEIRNAARVRPGFRTREREARHLDSFGEPRQIIVFLRFSSIVQKQFRRAERIRHHHGYSSGAAACRELGNDLRMRERREAEPAVLLRNDHAEEAMILDELPDRRRQIIQLMRNLPVVKHGAHFLNRALDKCFFFSGERRPRKRKQLVPSRLIAGRGRSLLVLIPLESFSVLGD